MPSIGLRNTLNLQRALKGKQIRNYRTPSWRWRPQSYRKGFRKMRRF